MKKMICILLVLLTFTVPALAEEAPTQVEWPGYVLHIPEGVETESTESSVTFVADTARVVAIIIERVPDEDPAGAILRMLAQYDANAVVGEAVSMAEGFAAVQALSADKFDEGVDVLTVMVLSDEGDLLILSGYDTAGDEEKVQALLDAVLAHVKVHGEPILITEE